MGQKMKDSRRVVLPARSADRSLCSARQLTSPLLARPDLIGVQKGFGLLELLSFNPTVSLDTHTLHHHQQIRHHVSLNETACNGKS
jgi:hypothetical protein